MILVDDLMLEEPIGLGGLAEVWAARHSGAGERVAVKVLLSRFADDPEFRSAFRAEVRAMAGLDHPHVIPVYDYGEIPQQAGFLRGARGWPWRWRRPGAWTSFVDS